MFLLSRPKHKKLVDKKHSYTFCALYLTFKNICSGLPCIKLFLIDIPHYVIDIKCQYVFPPSTGKILLFYVIFYAALAGFFAGLLAIFWQTLDTERPKWQLDQSIIGTNPGLGFRPMPPEANLGSTLIWYKSNRPDNIRYWLDTVNKFLDGKHSENCSYLNFG